MEGVSFEQPTICVQKPVLFHWLRSIGFGKPQHVKFELEILEEIAAPTILVKNSLKILLIDFLVGINPIVDLISKSGINEATKWMKSRMPTLSNFRKGDFGEVLVGSILIEFSSYSLPIRKLKHRVNPDSSPPGTDIIALKMENRRLKEVCFVESKLSTTTDTKIAIEAYEQLKSKYNEKYSEMLGFLLIHMNRKSEFYEPFLDYMCSRNSSQVREIFAIGLVQEKGQWSDTAFKNLEVGIDSKYPKTRVVLVKVAGLNELVEEVFELIGDVLL